MSNDRPLISVIITCYNYARYIGGAIECALAQTYAFKEVIVVNDGSTDDSPRVIARYSDHVRVVDQTNQGAAAAYNRGFAESTGELIVLLDADDRLHPDALARAAAEWSPRCAKIQWDLGIIDDRGRDLGRRFCNFDESYDVTRVRESFSSTGTYRWPVSAGNAYSRWWVSKVFPLDADQWPDGTLNTIAPVYGDVVTIASVLGHYRIHGSNLWSSNGSDFSRLPHRIEQRSAEIANMQRHARRRGLPLPRAKTLDHEVAFINYRLMAKKLGLSYAGDAADSTWSLVASAYRLLRVEKYPRSLGMAHGVWFGLLAVAPRAAARRLIGLRFVRGSLTQPYRDGLDRAASSLRSAGRALVRMGRAAQAAPE